MLILDRFDMARWIKACLGFLFVGFLCLFITGSGPARQDRNDHQTLEKFGIPTTATVESQVVWHSKSTHYRLYYRYQIDGETYKGGNDVDVDKSFYDQHPEGSTLEVRYLPSDPAISSSDPGSWLRHDLLSRIVSLAFATVGVGGLICAGISART